MRAAFATLDVSAATASFEIRTGEGHVIQSLSDGVAGLRFLDSAR